MRRVPANGIHLAVAEAGSGYPVVLLHGFPELAFSWRHQLPALAAAGFHAIAPDLRGYGASDKPGAVESYRLENLVADVVGLVDELGFERIALVGHDWGSIVAWTMAILHPGRVERLVSLNVPYRGHCNSFPSTAYIEEHLSDRFGYVLMLQQPGVAEAWFASDPAGKLGAMYRGAAAEPGFLSDEEFQTYLDAFMSGGITGPANFYRNIDRNERDTAALADAPITMPTLMVAADRDPVLPAALTNGMERWVPDLRVRIIENCGHWTQQEQPAALNEVLVEFLHDLPGS